MVQVDRAYIILWSLVSSHVRYNSKAERVDYENKSVVGECLYPELPFLSSFHFY